MIRLQRKVVANGTLIRVLALLLAAALTVSCSQQLGVLSSNVTSNPTHELPFDRTAEGNGASPTQALTSVAIPAGTPITAVLLSSLSSGNAHSGDSFEAILDEPIVIQGHTLASRGAAVTGRVVFAKASEARRPGYLRITLSDLTLLGKTVDLQTSGIFAKGRADTRQPDANLPEPASLLSQNANQPSSGDAKFSTGRRLIFRVTKPLTIAPLDLPKMAFVH